MPRNGSGFTPAQRAYLQKLIRREAERTRDELAVKVDDAMKGAVQYLFLQALAMAEREQS